jgi:hypothetical protein
MTAAAEQGHGVPTQCGGAFCPLPRGGQELGAVSQELAPTMRGDVSWWATLAETAHDAREETRARDGKARGHHASWRRGGGVAARGARAAVGDAGEMKSANSTELKKLKPIVHPWHLLVCEEDEAIYRRSGPVSSRQGAPGSRERSGRSARPSPWPFFLVCPLGPNAGVGCGQLVIHRFGRQNIEYPNLFHNLELAN